LDGRYSQAAILETLIVGDGQKEMSTGPKHAADLLDRPFRVLEILQSLQRHRDIEGLRSKRQPIEVGANIFGRVVTRGASQRAS
jgi:hypothetical protein